MSDLNDWTSLTNDPVDENVRSRIINHLNNIRNPLPENNYDIYLKDVVAQKRVLDVGVCEHTLERASNDSWKHNIILENANYSLGIDIIDDLVAKLSSKGINVKKCDATSEEYLGESFDIIHVGDVIEHVDSPVKMMEFCSRHLSDGGKIVVRTPNPYCFDYVHLQKKFGTDKSNLEHMFYICPIHAMEIARRSGLKLSRYYTLTPGGVVSFLKHLLRGRLRHAFAELFSTPESYSTIYVYEFSKANS